MSPGDRLTSAFRALESPYRRQLLVALSEENPQDDEDCDPLDIIAPDEEPDVLETELVHHHLPMLEEAGYIEWEQESHTIRRGPNWGEIGPLIELMNNHRDELPEDWL
ncbi:transcriptional regulator [Haloarcula laminariae]|uniref:transcriptional regulator n=1 Tax=Haloarcula laminariae TaxID=2961577 RepID=UPI002406F8F3|nr:transcriptional regulator [Halomicroarcula sp. FL173]